jgi:enoyl-CoA hydratase/carnithine racemase
MSSTSSPAGDPEYFTKYKNFALSRSVGGVLTLRFHTDGGPHTFDGTTHHDLPRLLEDIAFDSANRVLVLTGTGDSFIPSIDGPSLGRHHQAHGLRRDVHRGPARSPAARGPGDPDHRGGQRPRSGAQRVGPAD